MAHSLLQPDIDGVQDAQCCVSKPVTCRHCDDAGLARALVPSVQYSSSQIMRFWPLSWTRP